MLRLISDAVEPHLSHHMNAKLTRKSLVLVSTLVIVMAASIFTYSILSQAKINNVEQKLVYIDYGELVAMPRTSVYAELYCFGSLIDLGNWTGVRLGLLLGEAGYNQQAGTVELVAMDGYRTEIPYSVAVREDVIIAYEKDGSLLAEATRLVVPDANGDEWISNIAYIKIITS